MEIEYKCIKSMYKKIWDLRSRKKNLWGKKKVIKMAGKVGFEPTTNRLTVYCATAAPLPNYHFKYTSYKNYWRKCLVHF